MNTLKIAGQSFTRGVTSNQRAEKQRDESFIASSLVKNKDNKQSNGVANKDLQANTQQTTEDRSKVLLEQRKQEMAQQLSDKEKAQQQVDKSQELSMQRQIEERSAVNRQKLKGSYAAVQQNDNQQQAQQIKAEQNKEVRQEQEHHTQDAINLVV